MLLESVSNWWSYFPWRRKFQFQYLIEWSSEKVNLLLSIGILLYFGVLITNMIMKITNKVILTVICRAIWLSVTTQHACQYVLSCWKMDKTYNFFTTFHAKWLSSHLSALHAQRMWKKLYFKCLTLKMTLSEIFIIIFVIRISKYSSMSIDTQ